MMGFNYTGNVRRRGERNKLFALPKWWSVLIWILTVMFVLKSCGVRKQMKSEYKIYSPIVDMRDIVHDYKQIEEYEMGWDYKKYCVRHHKWEIIKYRYAPRNKTMDYQPCFIIY
jgi:hypothetical protein|tara:strand:- start:531 stop:872 length:342 start_codon:yes stop_codon:yes gene_type:complete